MYIHTPEDSNGQQVTRTHTYVRTSNTYSSCCSCTLSDYSKTQEVERIHYTCTRTVCTHTHMNPKVEIQEKLCYKLRMYVQQ